MNSWVLIKDLPAYAEKHEDELVRNVAAAIRRNHIYPVDSLVLSPDGEFREALWIEDVMLYARKGSMTTDFPMNRPPFIKRKLHPYQGRMDVGYREFLKRTLR